MMYFKDAAGQAGAHLEFVPHEELDLTDDELARLKSRARKAVTMDSLTTDRTLPREYTEGFLRQPSTSYAAFLRGEQ